MAAIRGRDCAGRLCCAFMSAAALPSAISEADFDTLHDDLPAWRGVIESLAAELSALPAVQMETGTVLVALLGRTLALKLYPPFLRDHFEFECAMLARVGGRLQVPTPVLLKTGEREGWPWVLMSQLSGTALTAVWPALDESAKCALLSSIRWNGSFWPVICGS